MNQRWLFISWVFALSIYPLAGAAQSIQLADSLFQQGKRYDNSGTMRQAEFYYREAYRLYRQAGDTTQWLKAGKKYGSAMVHRSKNDTAMALYNMLLKNAKTTYDRADIYNSMGWASNRTGHLDEAMHFFQKSMPLAKASGDSLLIGVVTDNLGGAFLRKGNYTASLKLRQKALSYFKGQGNQKRIAITLNNIGFLYQKLSLYDKALDYFTQSLAIRKKLGNVNLFATSYDNIASIQSELGNYAQALIAFQKSLHYRRAAGDTQKTASTLNDIGLLYKKLGDFDKALEYYNQSLPLTEKSGNPTLISATASNIAHLLWEEGDYDQATNLYNKALQLRKKVGNPYDIAQALNNMVKLAFEQADYQQAFEYIREVKNVADSTNNYRLHKNVALWEGNIRFRQKELKQALKHYKVAYAYSKFLAYSTQLEPLFKLAETFHRLHSDSALFYGQKAIDIIEEGRSKAGAGAELKSGYFKQYSGFYIKMASWALTYRNDMAFAYQLVESAKARSLADELIQASRRIDEQLPEEVRIERNKKLNHIDQLYDQLESDKTVKPDVVQKDISKAELNYAAFQNSLHDRYPSYKLLKSPKPISLEQARESCPSNTAVLEYAVEQNELIAFFITADRVSVKQFSLDAPTDSSKDMITGEVQDFKDAILAHDPKSVLNRYSEPLYKQLIAPFENELKSYSNLIIVPDGALAYLPFEALRANGSYLIEHFNIKYEPSLTSLTLLNKPPRHQKKQLLAVAGSGTSGQDNPHAEFTALPSTLIEVDSIASHFPRVTTLKDEQVTEAALKRLMSQSYKYIHLATHGFIDEDHPEQSGLALSAQTGMDALSKEDGLLKSSEIYRLNLQADMVVLSSCNSGMGRVVKGEGMLGLQRSFFYAGTPSVVVSLWNVYDRSTAFMMNEFYKELLKQSSEETSWLEPFERWIGWDQSIPFGDKALAMRAAKLSLIHHPLFKHPIYWAPFIVVGR